MRLANKNFFWWISPFSDASSYTGVASYRTASYVFSKDIVITSCSSLTQLKVLRREQRLRSISLHVIKYPPQFPSHVYNLQCLQAVSHHSADM